MTDHQAVYRRGRLPALIAVVFFAVTFVLANVPGEPVIAPDILSNGQYGPPFECYAQSVVHGWPFSFLRHDPHYVTPYENSPSAWRVGENAHFSPTALLLNVATFVLVALMIAWGINRRFQKHGWRFGVIHLMALTLIVSSATAFFSYRRHLHQEQVEYLQHVGQDIDWAEWKPFGPHWLREITGPHMWNWGDRLIAVQVEHSDEIATLPGRDTVRVLKISTVRLDSMPSLAAYSELVAVDLSLANYDYTDFSGSGAPEFLPCLTVIAQCESLEGLGLYDGLVTDAGLPTLSTMPHLRHLDLSCNDITDAGLVHLAQMKSLRRLGLWGTKVTKFGVQRLRTQLPACVILWEDIE